MTTIIAEKRYHVVNTMSTMAWSKYVFLAWFIKASLSMNDTNMRLVNVITEHTRSACDQISSGSVWSECQLKRKRRHTWNMRVPERNMPMYE